MAKISATDCVGVKFGRLTVVSLRTVEVGNLGRTKTQAHCTCECGGTKDVIIEKLNSGSTTSCGCLRSGKEGDVFGRLMIIRLTKGKNATTNRTETIAECLCECGGVKSVPIDKLRAGTTSSCGCLRTEHNRELAARNIKHGMADTRVYRIWQGIKSRCDDPEQESYPNYGGRGVRYSRRWASFEGFYADMGDPPTDKHEIDRIDNDGHYLKSNCKWSTRIEQQNNRRNNHFITYKGKTQTIAQWSRELGLSAKTISGRSNLGMDAEDILYTGRHTPGRK
jgi:hypothetical protein